MDSLADAAGTIAVDAFTNAWRGEAPNAKQQNPNKSKARSTKPKSAATFGHFRIGFFVLV
jgi:hypothetical protein